MSDALSRINLSSLSGIGSGKRKRVPPRDRSLFSEPEIPVEPQASEVPSVEVEIGPEPTIAQPLAKPVPEASPDLPVVKATMFRVEEDLYDALTQWCQQNRITRETFLEAAILQSQADQALRSQLIQIATRRCNRRKEAKERRKAMTLAAKYFS